MIETPDGALDVRHSALLRIVGELGSVVVGFSGGADSTLLLKVAADRLKDRVIAVTAVSASYPEREHRHAARLAQEIGVRHLLVESHEFENPNYVANAPNRCFFCKSELFDLLWEAARSCGVASVAYGAILDDLGDFRPGMEAARLAGARAPLLEAGYSKRDVRDLSRRLGLRTWDRAASACLSSRIPHGTAIDPADLARVERAEDFLLDCGLGQVRVRMHGEVARIECGATDLARLVEPGFRDALLRRFKELGFRFVTLDLEGYRTGSLNPPQEVPISTGDRRS